MKKKSTRTATKAADEYPPTFQIRIEPEDRALFERALKADGADNLAQWIRWVCRKRAKELGVVDGVEGSRP